MGLLCASEMFLFFDFFFFLSFFSSTQRIRNVDRKSTFKHRIARRLLGRLNIATQRIGAKLLRIIDNCLTVPFEIGLRRKPQSHISLESYPFMFSNEIAFTIENKY